MRAPHVLVVDRGRLDLQLIVGGLKHANGFQLSPNGKPAEDDRTDTKIGRHDHRRQVVVDWLILIENAAPTLLRWL